MLAPAIINPALQLIGVTSQGDQPQASESDDARVALNAMVENWSLERLNMPNMPIAELGLTAGKSSYLIGPAQVSPELGGPIPTVIEAADILYNSIFTFPMRIVKADEYWSMTEVNDTASSHIPKILYYEAAAGILFGRIYLWPKPIVGVITALRLLRWTSLATWPDLVTDAAYPLGYTRALIYNLACEVAEQFGKQPSQNVMRIAAESKAAMRMKNGVQPGQVPIGGQLNAITDAAPPGGLA